MRWPAKKHHIWNLWFAWRPVKTADYQWIWLETVARRTIAARDISSNKRAYIYCTKEQYADRLLSESEKQDRQEKDVYVTAAQAMTQGYGGKTP